MAPAAVRDRFYEEVSLDVVATALHVEYLRENLGAVEGLVPEGANLKIALMRDRHGSVAGASLDVDDSRRMVPVS